MLWHKFHDKLAVHEVPAFSGIICKLTLADYCLTKANKWISGRCTSLQHLQWCSYDLISADCCWTQPAARRVFTYNTSNQQHQKHLERFSCELMSADCSLTCACDSKLSNLLCMNCMTGTTTKNLRRIHLYRPQSKWPQTGASLSWNLCHNMVWHHLILHLQGANSQFVLKSS